MSQFIPEKNTVLSPLEAAEALLAAWKQIFGRNPSVQSLATIWAQCAFETGRWTAIRNFNWGNIRKVSQPDDLHNWTQYECSEYLDGKLQKFYPPDGRCNFRAYSSAASGALDYLITLSQKKRYKDAWTSLQGGEGLERFIHLLKVGDGSPGSGGYFTDKEDHYLAGVRHYYDEFMTKKYYSIIPDSTPPPAPPVKLPMLHRLWEPSGTNKKFLDIAIDMLKRLFH